ncbi:MAG: PLP-dependent aminotransferase family protein [Defluviitaleaceae bacterium]|nr:PLP-dependent aminotransferase family protein [Defluviitaleaceae bacterium]
MDLLYDIKLNKDSNTPLYHQLAEGIRVLIEDGRLSPGEKLPSIRKFAEHISVNNITVVNAYKHLESRKILYSHIGKGTFVSGKPKYHALIDYDFDVKNAINFAKSNIPDDFFPIKTFKDAFGKVLDKDGINANENNVQIIAGIQQGIDMVAAAILGPKDTVIVESPAFLGSIGQFHSYGTIVPIDMQKDGMDLDKLEAVLKISCPKLVYITSYFQNPTCCSYSIEKKKRLLTLACQYNFYILEEDSLSEFSCHGKKIIPLKALDNNSRVILIKNYGGKAAPGLNIAALVVPKSIRGLVMPLNSTDSFITRVFELFLLGGEYYNNIESLRNMLKSRYEAAVQAANTHLIPYASYTPPLGGLNLWFRLKDEKISVETLSQRLIRENIIITPGAVYHMENRDIPYFRLSFAGICEADIDYGIKKISECIKEMRND